MAEITFKVDLNLAHDDVLARAGISQALKRFAQRCLTENQVVEDEGFMRLEDMTAEEWAECDFHGMLNALLLESLDLRVKVELNDLEKHVL